jgi:FkbM family methyltransferase
MSSAARKLTRSKLFPRLWGQKYPDQGELVLQLAKARNKISELEPDSQSGFLWYCAKHLQRSHSQIFQDLFVLMFLNEKRNGFFCDFGATDGVHLSNSYLLEKEYGWNGICAEPAVGWHDDLRCNRPNASIETDCVWTSTGKSLVFNEVKRRELSTINAFSRVDGFARKRRKSTTYEVPTISLTDLLEKYGAPAEFDYLSMDTEGSELSILQNLDFGRYRPKLITVEHNFTENREGMFNLLSSHGYRHVLEDCSLFDDWYVSESVKSNA